MSCAARLSLRPGPRRRERSHSDRRRAKASVARRRSRRRPHPYAICRREQAHAGGSDRRTPCRTSSPIGARSRTLRKSACRQHFLDHAQAQGKPEIEPNGIADHFRRKAMAAIQRITGSRHGRPLAAAHSQLVKLTMPMLRTVMSSIMRRRRGLTWAIGNSCLRDGLQHPHPLRQETFTKSRSARRGSGFVQSQPSHPFRDLV
jgi:hypothetical protein